jgi:phage baseplate assembly protein W
MDIQLIQIDQYTRRVSLKLSPKSVKGLTKLVQIVVLSLLNTPGKDILDPERGSGIPSMIGMNLDPNDLNEVLSEVSRRVRVTELEITKDQIGKELSSDEKLKEVKIMSVAPGTNLGDVFIKIRVINELGQQSDVVF